jgi:DNA-binding transcriptional LysR family regulator
MRCVDLLRHLRYFVVVAEELHFGRAAERLQIAQPPLSQRIKALERALGVELLVRTTRRVELTPAGALLLEEARAVVERVERLQSALADVRTGAVGTVRLGVSADLTPPMLAELLRRVRERHPAIAIVPVEQEEQEQPRAVVDRRIDLGFARRPAGEGLLRAGEPLVRPLGVLVAAAGPLAAAAEAGLERLGASGTLVLAASAQRDAIVATCHAHGFEPRDVVTAGDVAFAGALVLTSDAVAITEPPAQLPAGTVWRPLAGEPLTVTASAVWRQGDDRAIVALVADALRSVLIAEGGWHARDGVAAPSAIRPADSPLA